MTVDPLTLPLRPAEANELANLVFDLAERRPLTQEIRNRIGARLAALKLQTLRPHLGSLARDPVHPSTYYVAVDVADGPSLLLHMAISAAPTSSVYHKPLLIGRMRRAAGQEIVINAIPFGPSDTETIGKFATQVDQTLLPKIQAGRAAIIAAPVPAAFDVFRTVLKRTGKNLAAIEMPAGEFDAALFEAVRAGWREGYSAGIVISADADRETIRAASRFTRYRVETGSVVAETAPPEPQWDEFAGCAYEFAREDAIRMAACFLPALRATERVHEWIRQERAAAKAPKEFDFEATLPVVSAKEFAFCLHWLKTRGHAPQLLSPGVIPDQEFESTVREMAAAARHYSCQLSFDTSENSSARLESIARATAGRVNFRATGQPADPAAYSQELISFAEILAG